MAEFPALPLFTDAFIADTTHLNATQTGAYLMLLMCAWRTKDCCIPNDDQILARYSRMTTKEWNQNKKIILQFWIEKEGQLFQKRLKDERRYVESKINSSSAAGKASALKRKERGSTDVDLQYQRNTQRNVNENSTPTPTPTPIIEKEDKSSFPYPPPPEEKKAGKNLVQKKNNPDVFRQAVDGWNALAANHGLAPVMKLTETRKAKLANRLADCGGLDGWYSALNKITESDFCLGKVNGWKANFDFLMQESSFTKLLEGAYDNNRNGGRNATKLTRSEQFDRATAEIFEEIDRGLLGQ